MVDVNSLTDDELRTKLVEYGFPVMPITGTTRNLMAKKLKLLMESKGKSSSERRSLGKFSSDEESDSGDVKISKKDKNRRITMAVPPMQQSKASIIVDEVKDMVPPAPVQKEKKSVSRKSAKIVVDTPETNSDSEPEFVDEYKESYETEVPLKKKASPIKENLPPILKPQEILTSRTTTSSSSRYTTYSKPIDVSEKLENIRSRLSLGTRKDYFTEAAQSHEINDEVTPFLSNFTRRLSQMSPRNGLSDGNYEDTNSTLYSRSNYASTSRPKAREFSKPAYTGPADNEPNKSSNISFILIAVVALFFVVLAALYYGMHSGSNIGAIMGKTSKYEPQDSL